MTCILCDVPPSQLCLILSFLLLLAFKLPTLPSPPPSSISDNHFTRLGTVLFFTHQTLAIFPFDVLKRFGNVLLLRCPGIASTRCMCVMYTMHAAANVLFVGKSFIISSWVPFCDTGCNDMSALLISVNPARTSLEAQLALLKLHVCSHSVVRSVSHRELRQILHQQSRFPQLRLSLRVLMLCISDVLETSPHKHLYAEKMEGLRSPHMKQ